MTEVVLQVGMMVCLVCWYVGMSCYCMLTADQCSSSTAGSKVVGMDLLTKLPQDNTVPAEHFISHYLLGIKDQGLLVLQCQVHAVSLTARGT